MRRTNIPNIFIGNEKMIHDTPGKGHSYLIVPDFCEEYFRTIDGMNLVYLLCGKITLSTKGRGGDITVILKMLGVPFTWVEGEMNND